MTSSIAKHHEAHPHRAHPIVFEEFFDLGLDETKSPFLTQSSRKWGQNLSLKSSIAAGSLLLLSFLLSFYPLFLPFSHLILVLVYFLVGIPALISSIDDLLSLEINIDLMMTLAAFSSVLIGSAMEGGLLLVLFAFSHSMEEAVTVKAKGAINALTKLSPTMASVIQEDGSLLSRSVKDIAVGTRILIKAGEVVPLDGKVIEGSSSLNLVHLTGENQPVTKKPGDEVPSGGRNLEGSLVLEVSRTTADSTLSRIIKLVTHAQEVRPQLQRWFDKLSRAYATTIILGAVILALSMPLFLEIPYFTYEGSIYRALAFLIAASPCALIIAIPIAYLSAISVCAKNGLLLKGGITLDALASCKVFAFDKTGTLTTGKLRCKAIEPLEESDPYGVEEALSVAYALERGAIHPVAEAILSYAKECSAKPALLKEFKSIPGYGLSAIVIIGGKEISCVIGHVEYIADMVGVETREKLLAATNVIKRQGDLLSVLLIGQFPYLFHFEDTPRLQIAKTLKALREKRHMRLLMLTGDHKESAAKIAREMGIDEYYADLRPEDKLEQVSAIAKEKGLAMVGDGINDAPALARATVGICMGKVGSTAAVEAADVILLQDNIEQLDWLIKKAHQTKKIVNQNLFIAVSAILIASMPALAGIIPLWLAVIMHEGGTVLVGLNALRLLSK